MMEKTVGSKPSQRKMPFVLFLLGILATVGMVVAFFLPYSVATGERLEILQEYEDEVLDEDLDMTGSDLEKLSLAEYAHVFIVTVQEHGDSTTAEDSRIFLGIDVVVFVFFALTVVFFLTKKPVVMLIFSLLLSGTNFLMRLAYMLLGVPGDDYSYGIGRYIIPIASALLVACAIWLLVVCSIAKRKNRRNLTPPAPVETTVPAEAVEN